MKKLITLTAALILSTAAFASSENLEKDASYQKAHKQEKAQRLERMKAWCQQHESECKDMKKRHQDRKEQARIKHNASRVDASNAS